MIIDSKIVEAMIIFAYKQERYLLVEELIYLYKEFVGEDYYTVSKRPSIRLLD